MFFFHSQVYTTSTKYHVYKHIYLYLCMLYIHINYISCITCLLYQTCYAFETQFLNQTLHL